MIGRGRMKSLPVTRFTTGIVFSKCDDDDDEDDCDAFIIYNFISP